MKTDHNLKTLDQLLNEEYGEIGSSTRNKFEEGYENFKLQESVNIKELKKI